MVVLKDSAPDTQNAINETYLPWTDAWCVPGEDAAFSITAVPILMRFPGYAGFADQRTKDRVHRWLTEAKATGDKVALTKRTGVYPWVELLSDEFVSRRYQIAGMDRLWDRVIGPRRIARGELLKDDVGLGKAQPLDEMVLTPRGWRKIGTIRPGDYVIGSSGMPTRVKRIFPQGDRDIAEVSFTDGVKVRCDWDHLWITSTSCMISRGTTPNLLTTWEIARHIRFANGQLRHFVPIVEPVVYAKRSKPLPIDPYLLGVLLGDGGISQRIVLSTADVEIVDSARSAIPAGCFIRQKSKYDYQIGSSGRGVFNPLKAALVGLGLFGRKSGTKYIPKIYRLASPDDRLSILRGLMDTDASVTRSGNVEFCSTSKLLASHVVEIVQSLGGIARIAQGEAWMTLKDGSRQRCADRYRVGVTMPRGVCPFSLTRKVRIYGSLNKNPPSRAILDINPAGREPCVCLSVEAEDHLYVTSGFVVTHNTIQIAGIIARMIEDGICSASRPIIVSSSPSVVGQWHDELRRFVLALDAPGLVSAVSGDKEKRIYRLKPGATVYVIHHQMLRLPQYAKPIEALFARSVGAILDESSAFANHDSLTTRRARLLCRSLGFVIATNATPIENKLSDTFGQMSVVDEPVLGSFECFATRYLDLHPKFGTEVGTRNMPELRLRLAGSWFGRRHEDVGSEIPQVVSELRSVTAGKAQRIAYKAAADGFVTNDETGAVGLARLAAVERAALAADLANPKSESAKLDDLVDLLDGEISTQRVLIFTKYRQCAVFAAARLARFKPYMIHGGVSMAQRDDIRRRFCSPGGLGRILIGTEAMARGLNLQDASVVVNIDLPWNHAKLRQRVGRVARIGQKSKSVLVISYVAEGFTYAPIDRYFLGLVQKKRDLSDRVYGEDAVDELDSAPVDLGAVRAFLRSK